MTRATLRRLLFLVATVSLLTASMAFAAGPYQFHSVTPCRIADTRNPVNGQGTGGPALSSGSTRNFPIVGFCGVPTTAKAAALNVTVVSPTLEGFIKIWPFGTAVPAVSTINFAANEPAIANGAIVPLSADPNLQISVVYGAAVAGGTAHVILDVTGFFQ